MGLKYGSMRIFFSLIHFALIMSQEYGVNRDFVIMIFARVRVGRGE